MPVQSNVEDHECNQTEMGRDGRDGRDNHPNFVIAHHSTAGLNTLQPFVSAMDLFGCSTYGALLKAPPTPTKRTAKLNIRKRANRLLAAPGHLPPEVRVLATKTTLSELPPTAQTELLEYAFKAYAADHHKSAQLEMARTTVTTVTTTTVTDSARLSIGNAPNQQTSLMVHEADNRLAVREPDSVVVACRPSHTQRGGQLTLQDQQVLSYMPSADDSFKKRLDDLVHMARDTRSRSGSEEVLECIQMLGECVRQRLLGDEDDCHYLLHLITYWLCNTDDSINKPKTERNRIIEFNRRLIEKLVRPTVPAQPHDAWFNEKHRFRMVEGGFRNQANVFNLVWYFRDDINVLYEHILPLVLRCQNKSEELWCAGLARALLQMRSVYAEGVLINTLQKHFCLHRFWKAEEALMERYNNSVQKQLSQDEKRLARLEDLSGVSAHVREQIELEFSIASRCEGFRNFLRSKGPGVEKIFEDEYKRRHDIPDWVDRWECARLRQRVYTLVTDSVKDQPNVCVFVGSLVEDNETSYYVLNLLDEDGNPTACRVQLPNHALLRVWMNARLRGETSTAEDTGLDEEPEETVEDAGQATPLFSTDVTLTHDEDGTCRFIIVDGDGKPTGERWIPDKSEEPVVGRLWSSGPLSVESSTSKPASEGADTPLCSSPISDLGWDGTGRDGTRQLSSSRVELVETKDQVEVQPAKEASSLDVQPVVTLPSSAEHADGLDHVAHYIELLKPDEVRGLAVDVIQTKLELLLGVKLYMVVDHAESYRDEVHPRVDRHSEEASLYVLATGTQCARFTHKGVNQVDREDVDLWLRTGDVYVISPEASAIYDWRHLGDEGPIRSVVFSCCPEDSEMARSPGARTPQPVREMDDSYSDGLSSDDDDSVSETSDPSPECAQRASTKRRKLMHASDKRRG